MNVLDNVLGFFSGFELPDVSGMLGNIPFFVVAAGIGYYVYKRRKEKGGGGGGSERGGKDDIVGIAMDYSRITITNRGGDNAIVDEGPGGGMMTTGDDTSAPGGKAEVGYWRWKGDLVDGNLEFVNRRRGKSYGLRYVGEVGHYLSLESRVGSMEQGGMSVEIVNPETPEGAPRWTLEQIPGVGPIVNPTFVRGDTEGMLIIIALVAKDNGHVKRKWRSWNGGLKVIVCNDPKQWSNRNAWKVMPYTLPNLGARNGMQTTVTAVRPRGSDTILWGWGDIIQGFVGLRISNNPNPGNIFDMLKAPTRGIFGPSQLPQVGKKLGVGTPLSTEPGHPSHKWRTGPFSINISEVSGDNVTVTAAGFGGFKSEAKAWDSAYHWKARLARRA